MADAEIAGAAWEVIRAAGAGAMTVGENVPLSVTAVLARPVSAAVVIAAAPVVGTLLLLDAEVGIVMKVCVVKTGPGAPCRAARG